MGREWGGGHYMQVDWESHSEDKFKEGQRCLEAVQFVCSLCLSSSLPIGMMEINTYNGVFV